MSDWFLSVRKKAVWRVKRKKNVAVASVSIELTIIVFIIDYQEWSRGDEEHEERTTAIAAAFRNVVKLLVI